ncbi:MAG TPA: VCBS repeat-containing protein, partial [Desulfosarcina sp.]|nr:VCBS repeat-containing protein [Desulfosarcina sp.]
MIRGKRNITAIWLAAPTDRYRHGVLGDELEASRLVAETADGRRLTVDLPADRVVEDLEPRLADMDADGRDEILVVESHIAAGASLAVYGLIGWRLEKISATPFLGLPNRWLNPLGVGDFDGDNRMDIALVATPHIGGRLRIYRYQPDQLVLLAEYPGVSTHRIGSTQLGLGTVVAGPSRDRMLVPDQTRRTLMLLEWGSDGWRTVSRVDLPGVLDSSLRPLTDHRWQFRLENGQSGELRLHR